MVAARDAVVRRRSLIMSAAPIHIAGERLMLDPAGVLIWPAAGLLVVSDLHLEKGTAFARRGMLLPPGTPRRRWTACICCCGGGSPRLWSPSGIRSMTGTARDGCQRRNSLVSTASPKPAGLSGCWAITIPRRRPAWAASQSGNSRPDHLRSDMKQSPDRPRGRLLGTTTPRPSFRHEAPASAGLVS